MTTSKHSDGATIWQRYNAQVPDKMKVFYTIMVFLVICMIVGSICH